jgi:transcriptional regulator with XRE-family HTH domain
MVRTPEKNFLRAWREHRRMTQAKLAEAVGTTGAVISLLESGDRGLSDKWLRRLAPILGTRPGHLLEVDPNDAPSDILDIWEDIPEERREQARSILNTFRRTDTSAADDGDGAEQGAPPAKGTKVTKIKPYLRARGGAAAKNTGETKSG